MKVEVVNRTVLSALPGWSVAIPIHGDKEIEGVDWEPVIAWLIVVNIRTDEKSHYCDVIPVTVENSYNESVILRRPNGTATCPFVQDFQNPPEEEVVKFLNEERRIEQEWRAKRKAQADSSSEKSKSTPTMEPKK